MLTSILEPLVEKDAFCRCGEGIVSTGLLENWNKQIDLMQDKLRQWVEEKTKHNNDGYPLVVCLWCLQNGPNFRSRGEKVIKSLIKVLNKQKEFRYQYISYLQYNY